MRRFGEDFAAQLRVVGALLIREIYTRFGREGLGFAWIVAEPLIFAIPVLLTWSVVRASSEHGVPMMSFLWTGYLPLLMFRHVGGRMLMFVRVNAGLLYHRQVTIFDIFLARCLLEVVSSLTAVMVSGVLFYSLGMMDLLYGSVAARKSAWLGIAPAIGSGLRADSRWDVRERRQNLWRPCLPDHRPRSLDLYRAASNA